MYSINVDDDSSYRWHIATGIGISAALFFTWLYAPWLLKAVVVTVASVFFILGRYFLWNEWGRIKQRGRQKEIRDFKIAVAGFSVLVFALVVAMMVESHDWTPAFLR